MSVNCCPTLGPYDFYDVKEAVALRALRQSRAAAAPCNPSGFWLVSGFSSLCCRGAPSFLFSSPVVHRPWQRCLQKKAASAWRGKVPNIYSGEFMSSAWVLCCVYWSVSWQRWGSAACWGLMSLLWWPGGVARASLPPGWAATSN